MRLMGSSPRVRGKPLAIATGIPASGLIPACAGKTIQYGDPDGNGEAHPRVCGENCARPVVAETPAGSSPRVRGKPSNLLWALASLRLIPACAGKTTPTTPAKSTPAAHPRVCGENLPSAVGLSELAGSSPRVRGKPAAAQEYADKTRLIPACAGKI